MHQVAHLLKVTRLKAPHRHICSSRFSHSSCVVAVQPEGKPPIQLMRYKGLARRGTITYEISKARYQLEVKYRAVEECVVAP